jgi:hypothetical protein
MDLDHLKQTWQNSATAPVTDAEILKMIKLQGSRPIARLKKQFRKKMILLPLVVMWLYIYFSKKHDLTGDIIFWTYAFLMAIISIYAFVNYRMVSRLEKMDGPVYPHLYEEISAIEKSINMNNRIVLFMLVFFFILGETVMQIGLEPGLHKWMAVPFVYRVMIYIAFLILKIFLSKFIFNRKYKPHLDKLKEIIQHIK